MAGVAAEGVHSETSGERDLGLTEGYFGQRSIADTDDPVVGDGLIWLQLWDNLEIQNSVSFTFGKFGTQFCQPC